MNLSRIFFYLIIGLWFLSLYLFTSGFFLQRETFNNIN